MNRRKIFFISSLVIIVLGSAHYYYAAEQQKFLTPKKDFKKQLCEAIEYGNIDQARTLLAGGLNPNFEFEVPDLNITERITPLMFALARAVADPHLTKNMIDIVAMLLEYGADTAWKDEEGYTPLLYLLATYSYGVRGEQIQSITHLVLNATQDINAQNNDGKTALMYAAMGGSIDLIRVILNRHPNMNITDSRGQTVWDYVASKGDGGEKIAYKGKMLSTKEFFRILLEEESIKQAVREASAAGKKASGNSLIDLVSDYLVGEQEPKARVQATTEEEPTMPTTVGAVQAEAKKRGHIPPAWTLDYDAVLKLIYQKDRAKFGQATNIIIEKNLNPNTVGHSGTFFEIIEGISKTLSPELKNSPEWQNLWNTLELKKEGQ